jgi:hypothetical protein
MNAGLNDANSAGAQHAGMAIVSELYASKWSKRRVG